MCECTNMQVLFPAQTNQRYYDTHFRSVLEIFRYTGASITFDKISTNAELMFFCRVDQQWVGFDFSDAGLWKSGSQIPIFKFHHKRHEKYENVFPFTPVSFYDWKKYFALRNDVTYSPSGRRVISMRQRPHGNAEQRRLAVMAKLASAYGEGFASAQLPQNEFWRDVSNIRLSVCVPGQNNNMIDRGQLQYMALGAATVSPFLPELLPFNENFDECYLPCSESYEDLLALIDHADDATLSAVGLRAAALFERTSTPERLTEWVDRCISVARKS